MSSSSDGATTSARVWSLIDGFNWYYAIRDGVRDGIFGNHRKWLDYKGLAESVALADNPQCTVTEVRWYTAYVRDDQRAADRHRWYLRALKSTGVRPVIGAYKPKSIRCRATCRQRFTGWEEKATDVNIAIDLVHGAAT